jgi:hypothetical protein
MVSQNPYDFITSSPAKSKKSLLPGGNSRTGRLLIVGAAGIALLIVILVFVSFLNSGSTALKAYYTELTQQQTELIRISTVAGSKARHSDTKNLAITTQYSIASQQTELLSLAKKAGAPTDPKSLALGKNTSTDAALTTAEQANQFDAAFIKELVASLQAYQKQLKKIHDASSDNAARDVLSKSYNAVDDLLRNVNTEV